MVMYSEDVFEGLSYVFIFEHEVYILFRMKTVHLYFDVNQVKYISLVTIPQKIVNGRIQRLG